eukprot:357163-Chlamydomonas_euryale.AAC.2
MRACELACMSTTQKKVSAWRKPCVHASLHACPPHRRRCLRGGNHARMRAHMYSWSGSMRAGDACRRCTQQHAAASAHSRTYTNAWARQAWPLADLPALPPLPIPLQRISFKLCCLTIRLLEPHPVFNSTHVVSKVQLPGWLYTRQHSLPAQQAHRHLVG